MKGGTCRERIWRDSEGHMTGWRSACSGNSRALCGWSPRSWGWGGQWQPVGSPTTTVRTVVRTLIYPKPLTLCWAVLVDGSKLEFRPRLACHSASLSSGFLRVSCDDAVNSGRNHVPSDGTCSWQPGARMIAYPCPERQGTYTAIP